MSSISRAVLVSVCFVAISLLAACGASNSQGPNAAKGPAVGAYALWREAGPVAAEYAEHYDSLADLVASASAVIRGEVVEASAGRTLQGDAEIDRFSTGHLTVRVDELLAGALPRPPRQGLITVETLYQIKSAPTGPVLLALRWSPEVGYVDPVKVLEAAPELEFLYTPTNDQGVWVEESGRAVGPWLEDGGQPDGDTPPSDPVARDVTGLTLDGLISRVRELAKQDRASSFEAGTEPVSPK